MTTFSDGPEFPWGTKSPPDGYKVGDQVGIIHSDHEDYIFDNPAGEIVATDVEDEVDEDEYRWVNVQLIVRVPTDKIFLTERGTSTT